MTALTNHVRSRRVVRIALLVALPLAIALALLLPALGSARTADPVQNTAEPTISGSTSVGGTLTGTNGSWTGNPTTFKYNFRRCPPDGGQGAGNCEGIIDGPSNQYVLQPGDSGFTIRLQVKAWDAENDKGTATSNATAKITGQGVGPTNTGLPNVTGTAAVGQTLTADQGTWASKYLANFSNDWLRCDGSGNNCAAFGALGTTYVVADADKGSTLRARVTATNPAGTTVVQSAPTAVVPGAPPVSQPPPPPPPTQTGAGCPAGRTAQVIAVSAPAQLQIDRQIAAPTVIPRHSGEDVVVRYRVTDTCGQAVVGALVYATAVPFGQLSIPAETPTGANGFASMTFQTLAGFPLNVRQRSVQIFVRARKPGESLLTGIAARRLFAIPVGS